jgi:hypothetical protein
LPFVAIQGRHLDSGTHWADRPMLQNGLHDPAVLHA